MGKTITEKIFSAHLRDEPFAGTYVLSLDVVMCHEITTPIAITDLQWRGKDRVFDPKKIKAVIDHVTPAKDSKSALQGKIMRDWAARHGIADFSISAEMEFVTRCFRKRDLSGPATRRSWGIVTPALTERSGPLRQALARPISKWGF
jgi:hypothetical protein